MSIKIPALLFLFGLLTCCAISAPQNQTNSARSAAPFSQPASTTPTIDNPGRVIHVLVALCDNKNQGIVPVPANLGNGEDPSRNLYWGAAFGVKTYFSKSKQWTKLGSIPNPQENILERLVFKHKTQNVYLVADAYRGSRMKQTIDDFFSAVSGEKRENVQLNDQSFQVLGGANLVAFVGHNGLMDFDLTKKVGKVDDAEREAVVLACASKQYFGKYLKETNTKPLLWTTNLMAPEAYILHDAIEGWALRETDAQIRTRAAAAYAKYQRISVKSANGLLVTGW